MSLHYLFEKFKVFCCCYCCLEESTPAFDEFLQLLGEKVQLKGFAHYRGVLDTTSKFIKF